MLDPRISISTTGAFGSAPGIKNIPNFGSAKAFGFGRSTCSASCFFSYATTLKITLPAPTFISGIQFKEIELFDNWGSDGSLYIDGTPLTTGFRDFGRLPYNDRQPDTMFRSRSFAINRTATIIELRVVDITNLSEIYIDDLVITGTAPVAFQITSVSPNKGGNTGSVTATIRGSGFQQGATVRLLEGNQVAVTGQNTVITLQTRIRTTFDFRGQAARTLRLEVVNPNGIVASAPEPFTIVSGGLADLRIRKTGTTAVPGRILDYFIVVENVGSIDADNIEVLDLLNPTYFTLLSVNPPAVADIDTLANASLILWNIPIITAGEAKILSYQAKLSPSTPIGATVGGPACTEVDNLKFALCLIEALEELEKACGIGGVVCLGCVRVCTNAPSSILCTACVGGCYNLFDRCLKVREKAQMCLENHSKSCARDDKIVTRPIDPNEKAAIAKRFIQPDQLLIYPIHFENVGNAEARDVFVTDVLDPNLDISTLELLTPTGGSFNVATRTVRWDLLGRNLQPRETDNLLLSIRTRAGLPSGTVIRNSAKIQFEIFDPIVTNEVVNIIDSTRPTSAVKPLPPETSTLGFPISWSGADAIGEIDFYTIFVSVDGGAFTPFFERTRDTSATFRGELGKTYSFYSIATDTAGNVEVKNAVAETTTRVAFNFDVCLQDDRSGDTLRFNSLTGEYQFTRCGRDGFTISGRGQISRVNCLTKLASPRVSAVLDRCPGFPLSQGSARVFVTPLGPKLIIEDRDTRDNVCACR
ncbi:MAG: DUF7619 domain-containing protein [Blastocatellia bacterium]